MKKGTIWLAAAALGIVNAIILYVFELVGVNFTYWFWTDLLPTNDTRYRWFLVPIVAVVLSILLSGLIKLLGQKRVVNVDDDLMADMQDPDAPSTLKALGIILAIGALSLIAGASLGPEASLVAASITTALWMVNKVKLTPAREVAVLASIGALLVAFLGSIIMMLVPLLFLIQKKQFKLKPALIIMLASAASYATILLLDSHSPGYGSQPSLPSVQPHDFLVALIVGFVTSLIALALTWFIKQFAVVTSFVDKKLPWYISGAIFGLILGILYLAGGPTVEFSGDIGSHLLAANAASLGALALASVVLVKLMATSWSKAAGYRGGLVFPSIYMGVALGLFVGALLPQYAGAGAMIGGIAGILSAGIGSPIIAALFVLAILPLHAGFVLVALCAIIGTIVFDQIKKRVAVTPDPKELNHS